MARRTSILWLSVLLCSAQAFSTISHRQKTSEETIRSCRRHIVKVTSLDGSSVLGQSESHEVGNVVDLSPLAEQIRTLSTSGQLQASVALLKEATLQQRNSILEDKAYQILLQALSQSQMSDAPEIADELLSLLLDSDVRPTNEIYNHVISIWSKSSRREASSKCVDYLEDLWKHYDETGDLAFVPMRSSYISTITALSRSKNSQGQANAEKAESLLEEMEEKRQQFPQLTPNTIAVNGVL